MSQKPKILIVDDEQDVAEVLVILLDDYFDCEICITGRDALDAIENDRFDALVTDLEMPDVSGLELIRQAKALKPEMKLFVSTGHGRDHPKVLLALEAGVNNTLQKPFLNPDQLVDCLLEELHVASPVKKNRSSSFDQSFDELR